MFALGLAGVVVERSVLTYRRSWIAFATGFLEPVFYLLSLGVGLGALVDGIEVGGRAVTYAQFVAPAMLAMSAMNGAVFDATYGMFFKLRHMNTFAAMLATPVTPRDIALGETLWSLIRGGCYALGFLLVAASLGLVTSWWALLALPAAAVIGFVFSTVGMAASSWIRNFQDFDYLQMALVSLTLLSATFFPVEVYPTGLRWLVNLSPLYHGVVIERALMLGLVHWSLLGHLLVLLAMGAAGLSVTRRRLTTLLLT